MPPPRVPPLALEKAQEMLKRFRSRARLEWKAFEIVNADEEVMSEFLSPFNLETALLRVMESKVRLPCIVCQGYQGVIWTSITFTSSLQTKERIGHLKFLPVFYCIFYPKENVFYSTRNVIPELISSSILEAFKGIRINKLPLEGRDFQSLRQLNQNRKHKGVLFRRPVQDTHPISFIDESTIITASNEIIQNEDEALKKRKNDYYRKHFDPETDPKMSKLTISSSTRFSGLKKANQLQCDLKVTFRTENLLNFINFSMDRGILSYPLNPYFENVVRIGRTSIAIGSEDY